MTLHGSNDMRVVDGGKGREKGCKVVICLVMNLSSLKTLFI